MIAMENLSFYLLGESIIGSLTIPRGIPTAPIASAILNAGLVSMSGKIEIAEWPPRTKKILEKGIKTIIGNGLTKILERNSNH